MPFNRYWHVARNFRALAQGEDGSDVLPGDLARYRPTPDDRARARALLTGLPPGRPYVVLNPNAGRLSLERRWPVASFAEIAARFADEDGLPVVLVGTASEREYTEGVLRAIHRAEAPAPRAYRTTWPWRSFARKDAKPMPIGEPQLLRFALLPVAWRFAGGSRLRLSISGADADHFVQTPHGRPPLLNVLSGGENATMLELPIGGG